MKKAVLVLTLAISSTGLKAEESQVPFKVGDVIRLSAPYGKTEFPDQTIVVREVKGNWVSGLGSIIKREDGELFRNARWFNTAIYLSIEVNKEEDLRSNAFLGNNRLRRRIPDTNSTPTYEIVDGEKRRVDPNPGHNANKALMQETRFAELMKKAEAGEADAQYAIGAYYERGIGVGKDEKEAVKWYTKSAEQGNDAAKLSLEQMKSKQ
jgi:hypothetical protein